MMRSDIESILRDVVRLDASGEYAAAMELLRPLLKAGRPGPFVVEAYAVLAPHFEEHLKALDLIESTLPLLQGHPSISSRLHFQAASIFDSIQQFDQAFSHYMSANSQLPVAFDINSLKGLVEVQRTYFTRSRLDDLGKADTEFEQPVFIVGMPRSGTSLTEQILASHSKIHGAGELNTMNELVAAVQDAHGSDQPYPSCLGQVSVDELNASASAYIDAASQGSAAASRYTDKMPSNCMHLGFIEMLLPLSRIIHCRRHPLDTCLSCFFQNFANTHQYSRRLDLLAEVYRVYMQMIDVWEQVSSLQMMHSRYEDLVSDQQSVTADLLSFCDVGWEQACLEFDKTDRLSKTCSYKQVRNAMYDSSVGRWQNYEKHIGPLIDGLEDVVEDYESD